VTRTHNLPEDLSTLTKEQLDMIYSQTLANYSKIDDSSMQTPQFDAIKQSGLGSVNSLRQNIGTYSEIERAKADVNIHIVREPPPESREHLWRQAPIVGKKLN
jgi:hypothetical protein